jgi:microcystin-dependent protein
LLGTQFGGDGVNTFALPDLRGRVVISATSQYRQGSAGGAETVTLTTSNLPPHTHQLNGNGDVANSDLPVGHYLATVPQPSRGDRFMYAAAQNLVGMNSQSVTTTGGSHAHNNIQPYLAVNYCIALDGMWPTRD